MIIKIPYIIIATILTFLGTIFCGAFMTLPQVYASEPIHCAPSALHHHEEHSTENLPCHGSTNHSHQPDSYTLQRNSSGAIDGDIVTKVFFQLPLQEILVAGTRHPQHFGYMHERWRYRAQHIQIRKKE